MERIQKALNFFNNTAKSGEEHHVAKRGLP